MGMTTPPIHHTPYEAFEILRAFDANSADAVAGRDAVVTHQPRTDGRGTAREGGVVGLYGCAA